LGAKLTVSQDGGQKKNKNMMEGSINLLPRHILEDRAMVLRVEGT
jgi:hypothetical protein